MTYRFQFFVQPRHGRFELGARSIDSLLLTPTNVLTATYDSVASIQQALDEAGLPRSLGEIGLEREPVEVTREQLKMLGFAVDDAELNESAPT